MTGSVPSAAGQCMSANAAGGGQAGVGRRSARPCSATRARRRLRAPARAGSGLGPRCTTAGTGRRPPTAVRAMPPHSALAAGGGLSRHTHAHAHLPAGGSHAPAPPRCGRTCCLCCCCWVCQDQWRQAAGTTKRRLYYELLACSATGGCPGCQCGAVNAQNARRAHRHVRGNAHPQGTPRPGPSSLKSTPPLPTSTQQTDVACDRCCGLIT
jgi:hypothetical protein